MLAGANAEKLSSEMPEAGQTEEQQEFVSQEVHMQLGRTLMSHAEKCGEGKVTLDCMSNSFLEAMRGRNQSEPLVGSSKTSTVEGVELLRAIESNALMGDAFVDFVSVLQAPALECDKDYPQSASREVSFAALFSELGVAQLPEKGTCHDLLRLYEAARGVCLQSLSKDCLPELSKFPEKFEAFTGARRVLEIPQNGNDTAENNSH